MAEASNGTNSVASHACPTLTPAQKRTRGSPTLLTPHRPEKRRLLREFETPPGPPRRLFPRTPIPHQGNAWTDAETKALVEFVLFTCHGDQWPCHKRVGVWKSAAEFIQKRTDSTRSGHACRFRVVSWLKKQFPTPVDAKAHYFPERHRHVPTLKMTKATQTTSVTPQTSQTGVDIDITFVSKCFVDYVQRKYNISVPDDFLTLSAKAMVQLKGSNRSNTLYLLAKGWGTLREDETDSKFPTKRMPMGLIEHAANFFTSAEMRKVPSCPKDYRIWQQTMYCQFGQKWCKLHHGPLWSSASTSQARSSTHSITREIESALVNIPAISERTIRRDLEASRVTLNSEIQMSVLDEAAKSHPNSWWWLKADGCDLNPGLMESTRLQWSGDVDLNDGALQAEYSAYMERLTYIEGITVEAENLGCIIEQLQHVLSDVSDDLDFIDSELRKTDKLYSEKQSSGGSSEKMLINLAWKLKELSDLNEEGRQLNTVISLVVENLQSECCDVVKDNIPRQVATVCRRVTAFIRRITRHKRTAATHILVFMISSEERRRKPYSIPIQCIPYRSLTDAKIRELANKIIYEMTKRHMKTAGFATNGEWNSLRTRGNTRPLSVFQIRSEAKAKYSRVGLKKMIGMISPISYANNVIVAQVPNPAVSNEVLKEILQWKHEGLSLDGIIDQLRPRTVPRGYSYHTLIEDKSETRAEKLRSILSQWEFKRQVDSWHAQGIPFKKHLYVPEVHPATQMMFCEREDEGHVFKRIGHSLRQGGPREIALERFDEAAHDEASGLTFTALSGERKQSVEDVERLFSQEMVEWMQRKEYKHEAKYLRTVRGWRRACDERGLTSQQRSQFNQNFPHFILDELMPWHCDDITDFSLLEVNRNISGIRGFSRETLVALAADIESREWRRKYLESNGLPEEHPRASNTDDIECFFSILRESVGKDFTLKEVFYGWRKVTSEFMKRLDPELPFYYFTSSHSRFYEGEMPEFSEPAPKPRRPRRAPRRELLGSNARVTYAVRGKQSVRSTFHNMPVNLPPPPSTAAHFLHEHSYFNPH